MTFEPQCKTFAEVHDQLARVWRICEEHNLRLSNGTTVLPYQCVRFCRHAIPPHEGMLEMYKRLYSYNPQDMEFALAIVEGRPVFRGDVLYHKGEGEQCIVEFPPNGGSLPGRVPVKYSSLYGYCSDPASDLSWNPPQRTIEVNGVKVKAPDGVTEGFSNANQQFFVNSLFDCRADAEAFKAALEGK